MACNSLQTFGLNCARCLTSPTGKQLLTILSRTGQSKGCTAASRTPFVQQAASRAPLCPPRLGPSFHPFSHSMMALTPFCAADPTTSASESGPETRASQSATSRPARPRTPSLAVCVTAADCWVRAQSVLPQPSGSRFQTRWFLHLLLWHCHETVPEPFSYPARRFLHARDRQRHHRFHRRSTRPINRHRPRGWTSDLFSFQPRPKLRWSPVETCLHPWWTVGSHCQ
jgi:hypothetical protein